LINKGISKVREIVDFLLKTSLSDISNENLITKYKLTNLYSLKIINVLVRNHPYAQNLMHQFGLVNVLYQLSLAKHKDKQYQIQA